MPSDSSNDELFLCILQAILNVRDVIRLSAKVLTVLIDGLKLTKVVAWALLRAKPRDIFGWLL